MNKALSCLLVFIFTFSISLAQSEENAEKKVSWQQMNDLFGMPLFSEQELWSESVESIVTRLKLKKESETADQSRYRTFAPGNALGVQYTSIILSNQDNKPESLLIMFANKGDTLSVKPTAAKELKEWEKEAKRLGKKISADADVVEGKLKEILGEPTSGKYGQGRDTSEKVKIWTWNKHAILIAENREESLSVRIVTLQAMEKRGAADEVATSSEVKKELLDRVVRRENGDVVITGIPMVDQGNKGYCVPSTWTRCLQYMGIPADEYTLANAANTAKGSGTSPTYIMKTVSELVRRNGRNIDQFGGEISISLIKGYIDKGIPVMWVLNSLPEMVKMRGKSERMKGMSVDEYKESIKDKRKAAKRMTNTPGYGHMCMIIGYNEETDEIATSDSWGPEFAEEWNVIEAMKKVSFNDYYVIKP